MPRILVIADPAEDRDAAVLLQERVLPSHVQSEHGADQLIERVGWAINDADELERSRRGR